ncbi:MAG TPA: hypothetical protein DCL43_10665 [Chitinophagaceae bacterium]|nr:hypothetical protein [Chitinophagaceae bacterium]
MRKVIAFLLALTATAMTPLLAQENVVIDGNAQAREVGNFTGIEVHSGIVAYISQGTQNAVAVSAADNDAIARIITEVKNGVLIVRVDRGSWNGWNWRNKKLKAFITIANVNSIALSGGSIAKVSGTLQTADLKLSASGGSILNVKLKTTNLKVDLSGGSIANVDGTTVNFSVEASGGSICKGYDLESASAKVEASGGSIINLHVTKDLKADASGGSIVHYKGAPANKNTEGSGGSIIKAKD